jgi:hypothetical protein
LGFAKLSEEAGEDGRGVLAIDGKTLRRSFGRAAQAAVPEGGNEITAAIACLACWT